MVSKTTIAVDQKLQKKIKKLSALLYITQNAVIKRAITNIEKEIMLNKEKSPNQSNLISEKVNDVSKILEATQKIWMYDPEREERQKKTEGTSYN